MFCESGPVRFSLEGRERQQRLVVVVPDRPHRSVRQRQDRPRHVRSKSRRHTTARASAQSSTSSCSGRGCYDRQFGIELGSDGRVVERGHVGEFAQDRANRRPQHGVAASLDHTREYKSFDRFGVSLQDVDEQGKEKTKRVFSRSRVNLILINFFVCLLFK